MKSRKIIIALLFTFSLFSASATFAQSVEQEPSIGSMMFDLLVARPVLLGITAVGTATYVVSLPFTLAGGNADTAAKTLVIDPAKATFVRCLGCTKSKIPSN